MHPYIVILMLFLDLFGAPPQAIYRDEDMLMFYRNMSFKMTQMIQDARRYLSSQAIYWNWKNWKSWLVSLPLSK